MLKEGEKARGHASRLSSQARATLRQASQQVLASGARRQELEETEQVCVPRPSPVLRPRSQ